MMLIRISPVLLALLVFSCKPDKAPEPVKCTLTVPAATCNDTTDENIYEDWDSNACLLGQYANTPPKLSSAISITARQFSISTGYAPDIVVETLVPVNTFLYCLTPDSTQAQWGNLAEFHTSYRRTLGGLGNFGPGCYRIYYALTYANKEVATKGHFDVEVLP